MIIVNNKWCAFELFNIHLSKLLATFSNCIVENVCITIIDVRVPQKPYKKELQEFLMT